MIEYPSSLRPPLVQGYSREVEPGFDQSEQADGPVMNVMRSHDTSAIYQVNFHFTGGFQRLFWQWFKEAIDDGIRPFLMPLKTESGMVQAACRFTRDGLPRLVSVQGDHYRYSATVLVRGVSGDR